MVRAPLCRTAGPCGDEQGLACPSYAGSSCRSLGVDADLLAVLRGVLEADRAVDQREQRVIPANADIVAGPDRRPALPHDDRAGLDDLPVAPLHAQALARRCRGRSGCCPYPSCEPSIYSGPTMSPIRMRVTSWRWPVFRRYRTFGLYLKMMSFSPLPCSTTSPNTRGPVDGRAAKRVRRHRRRRPSGPGRARSGRRPRRRAARPR